MTTTTTTVLEELRRSAPASRTLTVPVRWETGEARDGKASRRISGHAAVFDSLSEDLGFRETLAPGCFKRALARPGHDPFLLYAHDADQVLARCSAGTLTLAEDEHGLRFTADVVDTTLGRDVLELVRSGHVTGCSFAFTVERDEWSQRDGVPHRRILEVRSLPEITITANPAYQATSVRDRELAGRIERSVRAMRRPTVTVCPYLADPNQSYFRDRLVLQRGIDQFRQAAWRIDSGFLATPLHGGLKEARDRLRQLDRHLDETRDLTTTLTDGGGFVPTGAPAHIAEAFAAACRARGVLPTVLPVVPLPERGMTVKTPRITTGVPTEPQATENTAATETDLVEALVESPVTTVSGHQDVSVQLLERSEPGIDVALAAELGRALAADLDVLLLTGSGTAPYLLGLDNVSGITSVTYTDASPTFAEFVPKLAETASRVATALGSDPTHLLWHPRRAAWAASNLSSTTALLNVIPYQIVPVTVPSITTGAGAGTNEDRVYVIAAAELPVYLAPVEFNVNLDWPDGTANGTARLTARRYCSALFGRRPEAVGVVSGTGLAAWY